MCTQSIDRSDTLVPLLTVAVGLGTAAVLFATPSVATPTAVAYGAFAGAVALFAGFVGEIACALHTAPEDSTSQNRRIDRPGAA